MGAQRILFITITMLFLLSNTSHSHLQNLNLPKEDVESLGQRFSKLDWENSLSYSVEIDASLKKVWDYAGDSSKAIEWSVYFDHITAKQSEQSIQDGQVGSLRRCFRSKDESVLWWDELVIQTKPMASRALLTYALHGFKPDYVKERSQFFVHQLYESIDENRTRLTFRSVVDPELNFIVRSFFWFSREHTLDIFKKNLENIKYLVEGKKQIHAYEVPPRNWIEKISSDY